MIFHHHKRNARAFLKANDTQGEPMIEFVRVDVIDPQPQKSKDEASA
jgi:hypothetical protein